MTIMTVGIDLAKNVFSRNARMAWTMLSKGEAFRSMVWVCQRTLGHARPLRITAMT